MPVRMEGKNLVRNSSKDHLNQVRNTSIAMALGVSTFTSLCPCLNAISALIISNGVKTEYELKASYY
jgi:hypothetical protein